MVPVIFSIKPGDNIEKPINSKAVLHFNRKAVCSNQMMVGKCR